MSTIEKLQENAKPLLDLSISLKWMVDYAFRLEAANSMQNAKLVNLQKVIGELRDELESIKREQAYISSKG